MRRWSLLGALWFAGSCIASAQIISNFDAGLNGYSNPNFGPAVTGVSQIPDPTAKSPGVMEVDWSFPSGGTFTKGAVSTTTGPQANGAKFLTYWVYLPDSVMPPDFNVGVFAQDHVHYSFHQTNVKGSTIPLRTWYPISVELKQFQITDSTFDLVTQPIFQLGIQIDNNGDSAGWTGKMYVDNAELAGVQPDTVTKFETTLEGYGNPNFGPGVTGVTHIADPTAKSAGVMEVDMNYPSGGTFTKGAVSTTTGPPANKAKFLTFWVYLPDSVLPADFNVGVFAQDHVNYSFHQSNVKGSAIPLRKWFPISVYLAQFQATDPTFDIVSQPIFQIGLQIDNNSDSVGWAGKMYVDNVQRVFDTVQTIVPKSPSIVLQNFNTSGVLGGFHADSFGPAVTGLTNAIDTSNVSNRVLDVAYAFHDSVNKGAFGRDSVGIHSLHGDTVASKITMDVFIPVGMPDSAQFVLFYQGSATGTFFTQDLYTLGYGPDTLHKGKWNTLSYDVRKHINSGDIVDTTGTGSFGIQVFYPTMHTWSGQLFYDNLTLVGLWSITGLTTSAPPAAAPYTYRLYNNYPNPFNPSTVIRYELKQEGRVTLKVYDILGQEVTTLIDGQQTAGSHEVVFDARAFASGVYFYTLRAGAFVRTEKMMLLK